MNTSFLLLLLSSIVLSHPVDWPHLLQSLMHPPKEQQQVKQHQNQSIEQNIPIEQNPLSTSLDARTICHDSSFCGVKLPSNKFCVTCPSSLYIGGGCPEQACMTGGKTICEWVIMPVPKCVLDQEKISNSELVVAKANFTQI